MSDRLVDVGFVDEQPVDAQEDGRRVRRERNREAMVDAMLELYRDGNLAPSSDEIAERAGLSPRSLFRYFEDIDDLVRAAITRQLERVRSIVAIEVAADAPLARRIDTLVEQRLRLFDAIGAVGQVARIRAPFQPLLAAQLAQGRAFLRRQIKRLFAAELSALGSTRAAIVLAGADVLCSFESYHLLREDQMLSRAKAGAAMAESLTQILSRVQTSIPTSPETR